MAESESAHIIVLSLALALMMTRITASGITVTAAPAAHYYVSRAPGRPGARGPGLWSLEGALSPLSR